MAERIVFEGELDLEHLNLIKALSAREMYVEELAQIAERDERIVITGADVGAGGKISEFKEKNGSIVCREIKGVDTGNVLRTCDGCIEDAVALLDKHLLGL